MTYFLPERHCTWPSLTPGSNHHPSLTSDHSTGITDPLLLLTKQLPEHKSGRDPAALLVHVKKNTLSTLRVPLSDRTEACETSEKESGFSQMFTSCVSQRDGKWGFHQTNDQTRSWFGSFQKVKPGLELNTCLLELRGGPFS